jgi:pyridoxal phosphate enzyme (YggS family)
MPISDLTASAFDAAVSARLSEVRERIAAATAKGGHGQAVTVIAVTKTHGPEAVMAAWRAGVLDVGENRVQEAEEKMAQVTVPVRWHLIGHLQRNKAKAAVPLFECVQSIDKVATAEALDRSCGEVAKTIEVLLELNTSGEESKFGFEGDDELRRALPQVSGLEHLRVRGLMTVGPFTSDQDRIRRAFARLRELFEKLRREHPEPGFDTLSMGMSGDFEIAVEEGATMVRLGTVLFGPRTSG